MTPPVKPIPLTRLRETNQMVLSHFIDQGIAPWLASVLAKRVGEVVDINSILQPSISNIDDPKNIPDMKVAVERIVAAIVNGEKIIFAVDHDMDGTGSAAVLWTAFVDHFGVDPNLLEVITSHRLTEGYGITEPVVERILKSKATLIISADKGSSDEPRIKKIAAAGKDVIVTDHHAIPIEGPPKSAYAVVNPTRVESQYDPYICGAAVAFMVMAKVRSALLAIAYKTNIPSLSNIIDFVTVATIADCVALRPDRSYINRAFVKHGLNLLNRESRHCWKVFKEQCHGRVTVEDIAFRLAPPIAAAGRLDWAEAGFRFLIAANETDAKVEWETLQRENLERKSIERTLTKKAIDAASNLDTQSIVLYFEDGHSGVHGIAASRIVEAFGKPCAIFSPKGAGVRNKDSETLNLTGKRLGSGSFRGIPGFHVRDALQYVSDHHAGLMIGFGGHEAAAGATILIDDFEKFSSAFEEAVKVQLGDGQLNPIIWMDGDIDGSYLSLETLDALLELEPWGKDFPLPIFCSEFDVISQTAIGDGSHLKLSLRKDDRIFAGIWFSAKDKNEINLPLEVGGKAMLTYKLQENWYRDKRSLQLNIIAKSSEGN